MAAPGFLSLGHLDEMVLTFDYQSWHNQRLSSGAVDQTVAAQTTQPQETDVVFIGPSALMVFKDPFEGLAMTERRAIYGGDQALLAEFPEALGPALHLIDKHGSTEAGAELVHMLASAADPDYICNLSTLAMLPSPYKEAALVAIEHVLSTGLDLSQQSRLLALLRPRLLRLGPGRL